MATSWNKVTKATGTPWTKIPKAVSTGSGGGTINVGNPIGLLLALTYATSSTVPGHEMWTKINKASGTAWTKITKAL